MAAPQSNFTSLFNQKLGADVTPRVSSGIKRLGVKNPMGSAHFTGRPRRVYSGHKCQNSGTWSQKEKVAQAAPSKM